MSALPQRPQWFEYFMRCEVFDISLRYPASVPGKEECESTDNSLRRLMARPINEMVSLLAAFGHPQWRCPRRHYYGMPWEMHWAYYGHDDRHGAPTIGVEVGLRTEFRSWADYTHICELVYYSPDTGNRTRLARFDSCAAGVTELLGRCQFLHTAPRDDAEAMESIRALVDSPLGEHGDAFNSRGEPMIAPWPAEFGTVLITRAV